MIDCKDFTFTPIADRDLEVDLYSYLEYGCSASAPSAVRKSIHRAIVDFTSLTRPAYTCRTTEITTITEDHIQTLDDLDIHSQRLCAMASRTSKPAYLTAYAITLGSEIDDLITERQKESMLDAYITDAAGSVVIEQYIDQLHGHLGKEYDKKGWTITERFSPGYCDWDIREGQKELFRFLEPNEMGIHMLPSSAMMPQKSVTAIIIGAENIPHKTPCPFCNYTGCSHRKIVD